ncbi:ATP-binding protein [Salmonirosea aquatica]|uniref:histidine kinase n=1 Tax=Salmonirosea aquatica TaxID=2654236 RepID=A0A7C9BF21_9BACT|nr:GHKL domain-containing protein [Cytophagaceae bacterium SJW1-29]
MELSYLLIVLYFVQYIQKNLNTKEVYPRWNQWLVYARYLAIVLLCLPYLTSNSTLPPALVTWLWHIFMGAFVGIIYTREEFKSVRSLMLSVIPLIIIAVLGDALELVARNVYKQYDDYFDMFKMIAIVWVIAMWYQNKRQQKQLAAERQQRLEEEKENRLMQARKAELEILVAERTAEITKQKEELLIAVDHLKTTQSQLVQSEKMASLGELTAGIAHEIQNPLNFVNNFAEVNSELIEELREEQEKDTPDKELIEEILHDLADNMQKMVHHGKRADSIVKGMLMHSRTGSGEKEVIDVNALADEYMRLAYHGLRAKDKSFNAALEKDFQSEVLMAKITPQDFGRVLLNIFNNAFYAVMQKKKAVGEGYRPTVWLRSRQENNTVEIRIKDNGTGIPDSVRAKIFEPFFTTKPTGQGTGLGLSLSYEIIHVGHDGSLEVESEKDAFTEFIIRIPQGKVN